MKKVFNMTGKQPIKKKKNNIPNRLNLLFFAVFLLFSALVLRLGFVQVVYGEDYRKQVDQTENVTVNTPVPRGKIFDRYGNVVVDNQAINAITYTRIPKARRNDIMNTGDDAEYAVLRPAEALSRPGPGTTIATPNVPVARA